MFVHKRRYKLVVVECFWCKGVFERKENGISVCCVCRVFSCLQYSALYKMVCIMRRRQTGNSSLNCEQSPSDIGFHVLKTGIKVRGF
jgi:hypothetical protein